MRQRFRVGVVGGGVGLNHIEAYRQLPDLYSVDAFCDIDPVRAARVAGDYGIERIVSFIVVGVLLLLIGYLAPIPRNGRNVQA